MAESMSKAEERKAHRDQRKNERKLQMRIFYIALILLVVIIGVILSFTVFFHVSRVEVRGYSVYAEDLVVDSSGIHTGDNLFLINRGKVKEHIVQKLPYIGDVTVKISLPNKIVITVFETSAVSVVQSGNSLVLLNENGKVLGTAATMDEIYENGILEDGIKLERGEADEFENEDLQTSEPAATAETPAEATAEAAADPADPAGEAAAAPEGGAENSATGNGEMVYATPGGNVAQSPVKEPEPEIPVYVLYNDDLVTLKGVKVKSAKLGKTVEFDSEKTLSIYTEIMNLFIENSITGITELNLKDVYNITMRYENRIDVKVGSITNLDSKMAFAAKVIKDQDAAEPDQRGVIDLTIDKKAYFQPETTTKPTTTEPTTAAEGETTPEGETTTEPEGETMTNSAGEKIQVARTTVKETTTNQP